MRHPIRAITAALVLAIMASASAAYAQVELISNVPFVFTVGTTVHPAGTYTFRTNGEKMLVEIQPSHGHGASTVALAETRLATPAAPLAEGRVVFDRIGNTYYLSELWAPGDEGFLVHATKGKHTHVSVTVGSTS